MSVGDFVRHQTIIQTLNYAASDPEHNLDKLLNIAEKLAGDPGHKQNVAAVKKALARDNHWKKFTVNLLKKANPNVRNRLAVNFLANATFKGVPQQHQMQKELGCAVPFALLIDPTSACNLNCTGCWAGEYEKSNNLETELIERILNEARELGIYFIVLSGGEPLVRKEDLLYLARKFNDMAFLAFTNGTLVDEKFADGLAEAGNFTLAFSLEGFAESTDARRVKGVFEKIMQAMDLLNERGVIFGASTTYTRHNTEEVGSEAYVDMLIDKGCAYSWYFTYVPVGRQADLEMMATPAQRAFMYRQINKFRQSKPILIIDFWNDGETSHGCIAGGRRYLHINAAGDVEPCAFIHYANENIRGKSLREVLASPLFAAYQKRLPFNENHLRPCPLIDNPETLAEMVAESGAHSTQQHTQQDPEELARALSSYAEEWGRIADEIKNASASETKEQCRMTAN
ncbi:MAG: radical SAM protein [Dethiobacteria bacterium]|jgi:MoaA/NifB/PqqE/SkfB family radical SAM enzyme|nr:radical SAM protein [Bacillota bacterium]